MTFVGDQRWAGSGPKQDFPDVFDPAFETHIRRRAREHCAARSGEPGLIGWFIDNELRWGADWRGPDELLTLFLRLSPATPGRIAAADWLRRRHDGDSTAADSAAFVALLADRYFALTVAAIKTADPNHLVLGVALPSRRAARSKPVVMSMSSRSIATGLIQRRA
jgi:agarase